MCVCVCVCVCIKEKESLTRVITAPYQLKLALRWHRTI